MAAKGISTPTSQMGKRSGMGERLTLVTLAGVNGTGSGVRLTRFDLCSCPSALCFSFTLYKMKMTIVHSSKSQCEDLIQLTHLI